MRKLVVGCGYLGLRVAVAWLQDGHEVFALTRSSERGEYLSSLGIQPCVGDVTCPESLGDLPDVNTVLYAVGFDRRSQASRHRVYIDGLNNTWRALQNRSERWFYISSTSVYGVSDGSFVDESTPCEPTSEAGRVCWQAEQTLHAHAQDSSVEHVILRSAGIYGPDRLLRRVADVKAGNPLAGRPDSFLNLIHVDDIQAAVLAAEHHSQSGQTYLISDGQQLTRGEYFRLLAQLLAAPEPTFDPQATPARTSGLNKRCRIEKAIRDLQWQPQYATAESGLRQSLAATGAADGPNPGPPPASDKGGG